MKYKYQNSFTIILLAVTFTILAFGDGKNSAAVTPTFSKPHGFYSSGFDLTITSATPNASIKITLDGSDPRYSITVWQKNSPATFRVDPESTYAMRGKTPVVVVRACAVADGTPTSGVFTSSYIFTNKVVALSPEGKTPAPGWPQATPNANPQAYDYGMSSVIVNDPRYKDRIDSALLAVPSFSIVTDLKYLFSVDSGIYRNATMDGREWERPASIELIRNDNVAGFQINAGLRLRGGYSRHGENPKHAFRFFFRSEYGASKLEYPLFENEGTTKFDKVDLRTAQNYAWSYPGHLGRYNTMISDVFCRDLQREMGQPYTRSRFYHLYLNGVYWGLYQTQERSEARFGASYFGGSSDDYDVVKINDSYNIEATDGNLDAYKEVWNYCVTGFKSDSNYFHLLGLEKNGIRNPARKILVDVDNLIDYMLVIFYSGNYDGPVSKFGMNKGANNFYAVYNRVKNDGFRFFVHDAEHTLRTTPGEGDGIGLNENRVNIGTLTDGYKMTVGSFSGFHPQWLHFRLSDNTEYKIRFADHAYKHFTNHGSFTPDKTIALFRSRAKEIETAIIGESARWGNTYLNPAATKDDDWKPAIDDIINNYLPYRFAIVLNQLRAADLYPKIDPPIFKFNDDTITEQTIELGTGKYFTLQRPLYETGTIFYSINGIDPRGIGGVVSGSAINGGNDTTIIIDTTMTLKARVKNGAVWSALHEINIKRTSGSTYIDNSKKQFVINFELSQNYPNPFNPTTSVRFAIPSVQHVSVKIFDVLGKEICTLMNSQLQPGEYAVQFNGENIPSGIYFCRMQAGKFVSVKKMLLMK